MVNTHADRRGRLLRPFRARRLGVRLLGKFMTPAALPPPPTPRPLILTESLATFRRRRATAKKLTGCHGLRIGFFFDERRFLRNDMGSLDPRRPVVEHCHLRFGWVVAPPLQVLQSRSAPACCCCGCCCLMLPLPAAAAAAAGFEGVGCSPNENCTQFLRRGYYIKRPAVSQISRS